MHGSSILPVSARPKAFVWALLVLAAAGAAAAGCSARINTPAPPFALTDQRGVAVGLADLRGRVAVVTFLYTYCPDTCPAYLSRIKAALAEAPEGEVAIVIITVDPDRDTPERLAAFASSWPQGWHFVTGPPTKLARTWAGYEVYVEREPAAPGAASSYGIVHTAKAVVLDRDGAIRMDLRGEWAPGELKRGVDGLLRGERLGGGRAVPLFALLQRCGQFAAQHPWAFAGLVLAIMLPGLLLPAYLLRSFLRAGK